jgi:16S rRNA (adenine1518-N6/adenine1519-N6)-dimethyltransferase
VLNFSSSKEIDEFLAAHGLSVNKRFGQNFLVNPGAREHLVTTTVRGNPATVWEVGPGLGALSDPLAAAGVGLALFEIDLGFARVLTERYADRPQVRVICGDFIETWVAEYERSGFPDVIVGNLPYNSAAAIVLRLFEAECPSRLVFTVQSEAAARMTAKPRSSAYSSFTIICRTGWEITTLGKLGPGSFHPRPRVDSTMIELIPRNEPLFCGRSFFLDFCRCLFHARRKTIRNNLSRCTCLESMCESDLAAVLSDVGVSASARAEEFGPSLVVSLAESFYRAIVDRHTHLDVAGAE